jgi:ribonuclease HII
LDAQVRAAALAWGIGIVSATLIDQMGIAAATRLAMKQAIDALTPSPDYLLVDWVKLLQVNIPQQSLSKADQRIVSVAAASILAKVYRDRLLTEVGQRYPHYYFANNKGYGTPAHLSAIHQYGACPEHRRIFAPFARAPTLFDPADTAQSI